MSPDLSVLNLVIVKKGEAELPGLTDEEKPRMRGPKRASKIRKMFNLTKDDDVRHYVKIYGKKVEKVGTAAELRQHRGKTAAEPEAAWKAAGPRVAPCRAASPPPRRWT